MKVVWSNEIHKNMNFDVFRKLTEKMKIGPNITDEMVLTETFFIPKTHGEGFDPKLSGEVRLFTRANVLMVAEIRRWKTNVAPP